MGRNTIRLRLSEQGVDTAISDLMAYRQLLQMRLKALTKTLMDQGVEIAKITVDQMSAKYSGLLQDTIEGYYDESSHVAIIRANMYYAAYVEYGTGVVGAHNSHPEPNGWVYDVNDHGTEGWIYYSPGGGESGFHWTMGMRSRPFMYNTLQELKDLCPKIASEVFGR